MAGWDVDGLRLRLRAERKARGVTLEAVGAAAKQLGSGLPVDRPAVSKWEKGTRALPLYALPAYEAALGLPIEIIVGGPEPLPEPLSGERAQLARDLLDVLPRLDAGGLAALRFMVDSARRQHPK